MSRCFPFPPQGYEKKLRPEEGDLLKEEKRKEKKHKKEKKDKEKREGKEKRDKDKSDGKHREKKEKKDKHRDKKEKHKDKKKDKDKDKEKSSISEEARVAALPGPSTGGVAALHGPSTGGKLHERDEHKDRHISSDKGRDEHQLRDRDRNISSEKSKRPDQFHIQLGLSAVETEDSKFVQELGRRIRDAEKGAQSQLAERFPVECKRDEETGRVRIKDSGNLAEHKEKNKEKGFVTNKMDGQAFRDELKIGANAIPLSLSTMAKSKFEGVPRPLEENVEKTREEKQKPKERRYDKPREKNKDKDREKKSHGKQKDKEKEKKKEEKAKDKSEHKKSQEDKSRDINKNGFIGLNNNKLPLISKENIAGTVNVGVVRKRKDVETNGFLHESELRHAKLLRPSSSQQPTQNGKKFDTHPKADLFSSSKQEVATDIKVENKKHKVNGGIEGQPLCSAEAKASSIIPGAEDQIAEASKRPPHPDSKYLSQILAVPKVDDWSGFDDQEWLLSERTPAKKTETCPDEVNKEHWVWSEALQIEAADVCALPYVIPY
nr:PREDICTED: glutamic acid-rich protein-like [Nicotiana tabacum]